MKSGLAPDAVGVDAATDGRTRDRVTRLLLELGASTAAALGERLGLSPAAVRRHLDALVSGGTITTRTARTYGTRGRGRPARLYALTDTGRAAFPHAYDDLAVSALRFLRDTAGPDAVEAFATRRLAEAEPRYRTAVDGAAPADRVAAVAAVLTADGYVAGVAPHGAGTQLCQHHCPVRHVASEFPQLCEAETAFIGRLLGTHVQRLATIAHGDGVCTTYIPDTDATRTPMTRRQPA